MSNSEYEYSGLMATTWDLFRGDTSNWDDRSFFRDVILEFGQPALDVGCGTGRLLVDFMAQGMDIDGVDSSPEMLALCREKAAALGLRPALYLQTMETLDLPRRYQAIIVPSSSFQLLTDAAQAAGAMGRFYRHLVPGGTLAMPFMAIWRDDEPDDTGWRMTAEKVRPEDGATVRRWSRAWYDREQMLEYTADRYEVSLNDQVVATESHRRSPATRGYTQALARPIFEQAGFVDIRFFHEFTRQPATAEDWLFSALATRPSDG